MDITGKFTEVIVDKANVGDQLHCRIGYYGLNKGAWYWKTFLIAVSPGRLRQEISATRELGQEARGEHEYWLGDLEYGRLLQPDREIAITFMLFGHDDANYQWSWGDLWAAEEMIPNPGGAQLLATALVFIGPRAAGEPKTPVEPEFETEYEPSPETGVPEPVVQPAPVTITRPPEPSPGEPPPVGKPSPEPTPEPSPGLFKEKWMVPALIVGAALLLLSPGEKKGG